MKKIAIFTFAILITAISMAQTRDFSTRSRFKDTPAATPTDNVAILSPTGVLMRSSKTDSDIGSGGSSNLTLDDVVSNGATTNSAITAFTFIVDMGTTAEMYEIGERAVSLGFPVVMFRPVTTNTPLAVDFMPNGTPPPSTNGPVWGDFVDSDLKGNNNPANAIRIGVGDPGVAGMFGMLNFNGATLKPLAFVMGNASNKVGQINIDGTLDWYKNVKINTDTDLPTLTTESDVGTGTLATFVSTLTYDGGLFQNATRLNAEAGDLVLQASSSATDIVFIAGGALMSTNEVLRVKGTGVINAKGYTVATLPTGSEGDRAYVTDAVAPTYLGTLTGGGTVRCAVFHNGANWVSH